MPDENADELLQRAANSRRFRDAAVGKEQEEAERRARESKAAHAEEVRRGNALLDAFLARMKKAGNPGLVAMRLNWRRSVMAWPGGFLPDGRRVSSIYYAGSTKKDKLFLEDRAVWLPRMIGTAYKDDYDPEGLLSGTPGIEVLAQSLDAIMAASGLVE